MICAVRCCSESRPNQSLNVRVVWLLPSSAVATDLPEVTGLIASEIDDAVAGFLSVT